MRKIRDVCSGFFLLKQVCKQWKARKKSKEDLKKYESVLYYTLQADFLPFFLKVHAGNNDKV